MRGLIPAKIGGIPRLLRFTLPVSTVPTFLNGTDTGVGDLTVMDLVVFPGKITFDTGPLLVAPTATSDSTDSGRWQADAAGVVVAPQPWGLLATLATYQLLFGEALGRDTQSLLTIQPIAFYNLPAQFYLRSSATWNFDLEQDTSYIPVGLGIGKVWQLSEETTMNAYVEPQYSVYHHGPGAPRWQIFSGVNFQFALGVAGGNLPATKPRRLVQAGG